MSLTENLYFDKSVSIAFDWSNAVCAKPKPIYVNPKKLIFRFREPLNKQKEITKRFIAGMLSLFLLV